MVRSGHSIAKVSTVDTDVIVIGWAIFQMISCLKSCGLNLAVEIPNSIPNSIKQNLELTKLKL